MYLQEGSLLGLQFIYDTDKTGLKFGICEGPFTTTMSLDGEDGQENRVGLKLFFGPLRRVPRGGPLT